MGLNITIDIVPFVAHNVLDATDEVIFKNKEWQFVASPREFAEKYDETIINGWKIALNEDGPEEFHFGKKNKLFGFKFIKDNFSILTLDESEYNGNGYVSLAIISDNKESIELFIKDFKLNNYGIDENDPCRLIL